MPWRSTSPMTRCQNAGFSVRLMNPATAVASATVARTSSSASARAMISFPMSCGFLRAVRASPNATLVATSPNSARRAGSNCTTGSASGHSARAAAANRAASSSSDNNAVSLVVVGFIASDLRRAIQLLHHQHASPFVKERQRRKRPAHVGPRDERLRRAVGARDDKRQPRDPGMRQALDPARQLLAGEELTGAFEEPDMVGGIEQLEDRLALRSHRPRGITAVGRTDLDLFEPMIRPQPRAKIRERIGDVPLANFPNGDQSNVQAAGSRLAAARMSSGNARSFAAAYSRARLTHSMSSTSMISKPMMSSSGVTSMCMPSQR